MCPQVVRLPTQYTLFLALLLLCRSTFISVFFVSVKFPFLSAGIPNSLIALLLLYTLPYMDIVSAGLSKSRVSKCIQQVQVQVRVEGAGGYK